jgi:hypothetical protein
MNLLKPRPGRWSLYAGIFCWLLLAALRAPATPTCRLEIGPEVDSFHYREPGLMKEYGFLYGGFAAFNVTFQSNLVWNLGASLTAGAIRYDGQTMGGEPVKMDTLDRLLDLRTSIGYRWNPVTPFVGIGLRDWNDNLGAYNSAGYNRQTTYLYSPLGMEISGIFGNAWTLGARAEFDLFWAGLNHNTDFPIENNWAIDLRQRSGYGAKVSVFAQHPMTHSMGLMVEPFFQYWDIGESEEKYVLAPDGLYVFTEPANTTSVFGLRAGLRW